MPVSFTNRSMFFPESFAPNSTLPVSVNLLAFLIRFESILSILALKMGFCMLFPVVQGEPCGLIKLVEQFAVRLWLQKITTKEPSMDQLEVGIVALEAALGIENSKIRSQTTAVS